MSCYVKKCQKYKPTEYFVMSKSGTGTGRVRQGARIWRKLSVALGCGNVDTSGFLSRLLGVHISPLCPLSPLV